MFNHGGAPLPLLRISLWFPISCINCGGLLPREGTDHWSKFCLLAGELQHFLSLYMVHAVNTHHWVNVFELFINPGFSGFCKAISSFWALLLCITALSMYMKLSQAYMALLWSWFQALRYIGLYQRIYLWVSLCISTFFFTSRVQLCFVWDPQTKTKWGGRLSDIKSESRNIGFTPSVEKNLCSSSINSVLC